jgi:hypothetical protein
MKRKLFIVASLALAIFKSAGSFAQVSSYGFTQTAGSYGAANTGSMVGIILQDNDVTNVNLPFNFTFNGTSYSNINVCSNGYLSFNALTGTEYTAISDVSTQNIIAPFAQDMVMATVITGDYTNGSNVITNVSSTNGISVGDSLIDAFFDFGGYSPTVTAISGNNITVNLIAQNNSAGSFVVFMNGYIKQNVSGVTPNRICEFEYRNMTRFDGMSPTLDEVINFKVKLYETSNKIEFVYGPMFPNIDNTTSEVGLKGSLANDFNSRFVISGVNWLNSVPASNISDNCDFSSQNFPASGLTYAWQPCIAPSLSLAMSSASICAGQSFTITASGANTYSWSTGSNSASVVVTPSVNASYTITGLNGGCTASMVATPSVVPAPALSVTPTNTTICVGQYVSMVATGATSYTWSNGFQGQANASLLGVAPTSNTMFVVTGANLGCTSSASVNINVSACTGIETQQLAELKTLSVYPNPNSGSFIIKTNMQGAERQVNIYNLLGAKVYSDAALNKDDIRLNVSLPEGVYYVELIGNNTRLVKQMVITK